jgi:phosphoglycolate phosphatase-like HAD superfamily hydrolase
MGKEIDLIKDLDQAINVLSSARNEELDKVILADTYEQMITNTPQDISARYWLTQFMDPLSRKELKSIVDGFLINMINEEQAVKLVKFLMVRFPQYYQKDIQQMDSTPVPTVPEAMESLSKKG